MIRLIFYKGGLPLEHHLFQTTKNAFRNLAYMEGTVNHTDIEMIEQAIQQAYQVASPEEIEQLKQMEEQLQSYKFTN